MDRPTRRRSASIVALAVAVTALLAPAAPAASPAAQVDTAAYGWLASDGERHVAYAMPDGTIKVIDEADGGRSFHVPTPAGCTPEHEGMVAGGGQLAVACWSPRTPDAQPRLVVKRLDLTTRAWADVPGSDRWSDGNWVVDLGGIGTRRIAYQSLHQPTRWVDWRTGEATSDTGSARDVPDLEGDAPFVGMCAPLQRPLPAEPLAYDAFMPTAYDGSFAVASHAEFVLTVQGCDEPHATVLGATGEIGQIGGGVVTWQASQRHTAGGWEGFVHAYLPACRQRLGWNLPEAAQIAHVRGALYAMEAPSGVVRRLPLPTGCLPAPRVTVTGGDRTRTLTAVRWDGPGSFGAPVERLPLPGALTPRVAVPRRALTVRTPRPAGRVVWRVAGQQRWSTARADGRGRRIWRLATPPGRGVVRLEVEIRDGAGASARYEMRASRRR